MFGITRDQLGTICVRRNERIADLFKIIGLVEKAGTGIRRMKDAMETAGLKEPKLEVSENFFMITFFGHKKEGLGEISRGGEIIGLNERQKRALEFVKVNGMLTNKEYRELNKTSRETAKLDMEKMVKLEIIKRKGGGRGTYYMERSTTSLTLFSAIFREN